MNANTLFKEPKLHSGHMEVAVALLLDYRVYTIVPNVSWGLGLNHECDMLALDHKNRFTEIEIKISKSDLKADFKKGHQHQSRIVSRLVYAIPENLLETALQLCPQNTGIISVKWNGFRYVAKWERSCKHFKNIETPNQNTIRKFMSLGCMRIWTLKSRNNKTKLVEIEAA